MWIASLVLALQAPAAIPAPQFDAKAAQELLEQHSTAFGPSTRRSRLEVRRMAPLGDPVPAYELTLRGPAIAGRKPGLASAFVATAVPAPPAIDRSAFCADASGRLCLLNDPEAAVESACPAECAPVE